MNDRLITHITERLSGPLPGPEAQYRMAHVGRYHRVDPPPHARQAGVLALFYPRQSDWHLVLIERVTKKGDRHSGQVSFPGGRFEKGDGRLVNTALRETEEEIGVDASRVTVLGPLSKLYIPVSNYLVNPFVGFLDHAPRFRPQASEVASVLEVPLSLLTDPATAQETDLRITEGLLLQKVPYYNVFGKVVWGATAMMLCELLTLLQETRP